MTPFRAAARATFVVPALLLLTSALAQSPDIVRPEPRPRPNDFLSLMSAECASMYDGLRTATGRSRRTRSQAELQSEYQRECAGEEALARRRLAERQVGAQSVRAEQQRNERAEAERQQAQQQQTLEQCLEMRRIIAGKNARLAQLTPGEVSDLRRFEGNFAARCPMLAR